MANYLYTEWLYPPSKEALTTWISFEASRLKCSLSQIESNDQIFKISFDNGGTTKDLLHLEIMDDGNLSMRLQSLGALFWARNYLFSNINKAFGGWCVSGSEGSERDTFLKTFPDFDTWKSMSIMGFDKSQSLDLFGPQLPEDILNTISEKSKELDYVKDFILYTMENKIPIDSKMASWLLIPYVVQNVRFPDELVQSADDTSKLFGIALIQDEPESANRLIELGLVGKDRITQKILKDFAKRLTDDDPTDRKRRKEHPYTLIGMRERDIFEDMIVPSLNRRNRKNI